MKRILTFIITIVILSVQFVIPLSATGIASAKQEYINNEVVGYIKATIPNASSVSFSEVFPIYNTGNQTSEAVFVIVNNEVDSQ